MSNASHGEEPAHEDLGHAVPLRILLATWGTLVVLTIVTVGAAYLDLGSMNILVALLIAVVKSSVVALFFMHLWWDKPFHSIVFVSATLFVMLFITFALIDTKEYGDSKIPAYAPEMELAAPTVNGAVAPATDAGGH